MSNAKNQSGAYRSLGGGKNLSSKLCEVFATEELAHSMMSFNTCYNDTGLFGAYIVGDKEKTSDALYEILREWVRLGTTCSDIEVRTCQLFTPLSHMTSHGGDCPQP